MSKIFAIFFGCALFGVAYGLEFHPKPRDGDSSLISYRSGNENDFSYWINKLDEFLAPYVKPGKAEASFVECKPGSPPEDKSGTVCDVKTDSWPPCTSSYKYGFTSDKGGPCIFLTPTKMLDWKPEYYNSSTMPHRMPDHLKRHILDVEHRFGSDSTRLKVLWMSCDGEYPADKENIGFVTYFPTSGFDGQYFPIVNDKDYLSPLVALYFENPSRGVIIGVKCLA